MEKEYNPYNYDYLTGYKDSIEGLKENKDVVDASRLCYEALESTPAGRKLMAYLMDTYIIRGTPAQIGPNYTDACIYFEGYREAYRQLIMGCTSYRARMESEQSNKVENESI